MPQRSVRVKAALFAAGCFCKLPDDFLCITLQVLAKLVTSPTSEAQLCYQQLIHSRSFIARRLLCVHGKQKCSSRRHLCTDPPDISSLSFGSKMEFLLLLFMGHECSLPMKTMALKCSGFKFRINTVLSFYFPNTVFGTLL